MKSNSTDIKHCQTNTLQEYEEITSDGEEELRVFAALWFVSFSFSSRRTLSTAARNCSRVTPCVDLKKHIEAHSAGLSHASGQ